MSFIDDIVGGVFNGIRTVLGIPSEQKVVQPAVKKPDQPTTFERTPSLPSSGDTSGTGDGTAGSGPGSNHVLLEALRKTGYGNPTSTTPNLATPRPAPGVGSSREQPPVASSSDWPTTQDQTAGDWAGSEAQASPVRRALAPVTVWDSARPSASGGAALIGTAAQLAAGEGPANARTAAQNVERGLTYYQETFGRNGVNEEGSGVDIVVNDRSTDDAGKELFRGNGGYYFSTAADGTVRGAMRFGTGTSYLHERGGRVSQYEMLNAEDLTIHELTHGIINHETGQVGGSADEAGSVNEALADVMAASATRDWRIGEGMYSADSDYQSLRNIADPDDRTAVHGLWTNFSQYQDAKARGTIEEHFASGIVSHAAARMQQRLGGERGWQAVEQLFYDTINSGMLRTLSYGEVAAALRATAQSSLGAEVAGVVDEELTRAGL